MKNGGSKKHATNAAYARSGVDLSAGDQFSGIAGNACRSTYLFSPFVTVHDWSQGHFRGPRGWSYKNVPRDYIQVAAPDGIGTATIVISAAEAHFSSASRLVAMTAGDITRFGGLPLVFVNILEAKTLGQPGSEIFHAYREMMLGLQHIAAKQNYVLISGETAEMNDCVSTTICGPLSEKRPAYNWSGVMIGINHNDMLIDGSAIKRGDIVIALRDKLRSNGASLVRRYLRCKFGSNWYENPLATDTVKELAEPAALYDRFLVQMNGWYTGFKPVIKVSGIAHLSGGAIRSKFADDLLFPRGLSAVLDDLWEPPKSIRDCVDYFRKHENMTDEGAYTVLNGGQGALVIVPEDKAEFFCSEAERWSIAARPAGYIDKKHRIPRVKITSKFTGKTFFMRQ